VDNSTLGAYLGHRNIQHTVRYTLPLTSPKILKPHWRQLGAVMYPAIVETADISSSCAHWMWRTSLTPEVFRAAPCGTHYPEATLKRFRIADATA
jgi:hypothetical protein